MIKFLHRAWIGALPCSPAVVSSQFFRSSISVRTSLAALLLLGERAVYVLASNVASGSALFKVGNKTLRRWHTKTLWRWCQEDAYCTFLYLSMPNISDSSVILILAWFPMRYLSNQRLSSETRDAEDPYFGGLLLIEGQFSRPSLVLLKFTVLLLVSPS